MDFHETRMGRKFLEGDVPRLIDSLEDIAKELKRHNDLRELEIPKSSPDINPGDIANEFVSHTVEADVVVDVDS